MRPPVLLGITLALVATLLAVLLLAGRGIDVADERAEDRQPGSAPPTARAADNDGGGTPPPVEEEDEEDRDDRGIPRAGEDNSDAAHDSRGPSRAAAAHPPAAATAADPRGDRPRTEEDDRPRGPSGPPVDAPRELIEELAEERRTLVTAIVEELMPELRDCTAQSQMPEAMLRQAMLRVRVEENDAGFGARVNGLMGAEVEPQVEACYQRALDASPFPPPDAALDSMDDGARGYEVWVGAQVQDPQE